MADIQNQKYSDLYTNLYPYLKHSYDIATIPSIHTYRGTVEIPAGLTQKGTGTYPLVHAKDVQIGNIESDRLNDKLADYDIILRELYGRTPAELEALTDGRSAARITELEADNGVRGANGTAGIQSLSRVADILNNRTETIDDRLLDLRMFKTIKIDTDKGSNTNDLENGTKAIIDADNNSDILTINSENQWIILKGNNTNNSFTIGHYLKKVTPTTSRINLNDDSIGTIVLLNLTYDDAGHVTNELNTEYTLPYSFKTMKVSNNDSTDNITSNSNSIEANTVFANMLFIAGNKWINLAANNTNRTITIAHTRSKLLAESHSLTYALSNQSPKFGSNFSIANPTISFTTDAAGHVTEYSSSDATVTVKIPEPSLEVAKDINEQNIEGNVIVALNWDLTDKGKLIYTPAYIGSLTLTGYTALNENSTGVAATDTLNAAIAKLQKQVEDEVAARIAAITQEANNRDTAIKGLYGAATIPIENALTLVGLNSVITNTNNIIETIYGDTIPEQNVLTLTNIQSAIENLDATDIVVDKTAETPVTLAELAALKLDASEFEDFKVKYNALIDKLAAALTWDATETEELKFVIETEVLEEEPEP